MVEITKQDEQEIGIIRDMVLPISVVMGDDKEFDIMFFYKEDADNWKTLYRIQADNISPKVINTDKDDLEEELTGYIHKVVINYYPDEEDSEKVNTIVNTIIEKVRTILISDNIIH